ncbi:MAG: hypothetical protein COB46_04760 [Rhodospirillaceae bacterium]|nr:MAG: hypothetical protein COB46_04760 [Rhodospirillaceae bacterium]
MELHFTVWQFVRLMVHGETHPNPLFEPWADIWHSLDADLTALAESDGNAYSDMMMNQDVVMQDATPAQARAAAAALKQVMDELDAEIPKAEDGSDPQLSLKFERRELRQLTRKFNQQAKTDTAS